MTYNTIEQTANTRPTSDGRRHTSVFPLYFGIAATFLATTLSGCGDTDAKLSNYASPSKTVIAADNHELRLTGHGTKFRLIDCALPATGKDRHIEYVIAGETVKKWKIVEIDGTEWVDNNGQRYKKFSTRVNDHTPASKELESETRKNEVQERLNEYVAGRDDAQIAPIDAYDE